MHEALTWICAIFTFVIIMAALKLLLPVIDRIDDDDDGDIDFFDHFS